MSNLITEEIITNASGGDEAAFRMLYDRYSPGVFRTALRFLHSEEVAQDIIQEVFSIIWQRREKLSEIRDIEYYLATMAKHLTYRELARLTKEQTFQAEYGHLYDSSTRLEENNLTFKEYEHILQQFLSQLPPQQRKVFELARFKGMSHDDIATQLHLSKGTVKNHMVRALSFLKQQLGPFLGIFLLFLKK